MKLIRHPNVIRMFEVSIALFMTNIPIVSFAYLLLWQFDAVILICIFLELAGNSANYRANEYLPLQVMASKTKIYIVMEFVTGGELFDKIVCSMI